MEKTKRVKPTLSKKKEKFLSRVALIHEQESSEVGFVIRSMVSASMPHSRVNGCQFKRKNQNISLTIMGNEEAGGVPYGSYPRLILSWVTSEAVRGGVREIYLGHSLSDFMKNLGLTVSGGRWGTINRFKKQLKMLFSSSISITYEDDRGWHNSVMTIADKTQIFWDPLNPDLIDLFNSKIVLSEPFFQEITSKPVPVDMKALEALKESSLGLDIYFWLTYRMSYLSRDVEIPFEKLYLQFGSGYQNTHHGRYEFKRKFLIQLKKVLAIYPDANVFSEKDSIILKPSSTHIKKIIDTNCSGNQKQNETKKP